MSEPIRVLQMIGGLNVGGSQTMILNLYRRMNRDLVQFDFILDHEDSTYFADEVRSLKNLYDAHLHGVERPDGQSGLEQVF